MAMHSVKLIMKSVTFGSFVLEQKGSILGEMRVEVSIGTITVVCTEVYHQSQRQFIAFMLLSALARYARTHVLQVVAICPFVHTQFMLDSCSYSDIWKKTGLRDRGES